jgi:uncharacterized membrane protein
MFTLPNWEGLHPMVVHFPLVLLLLCPLFLAIALIRREPTGPYTLSGWALLVLGTALAFLAKETGEAAVGLVTKTDMISQSIHEHAHWAVLTCGMAAFASLTLTTFLWASRRETNSLSPTRAQMFLVLILMVCLVLSVLVVITAHEGAFLVHGLGVTNPGSFPPPGL